MDSFLAEITQQLYPPSAVKLNKQNDYEVHKLGSSLSIGVEKL